MSDIPENVRDWEAKHPSVEQLRKECERLKAELGAWHSQFGSQLSHAVEERERLKAEVSILRGDLSKWAAACDESRIGLVLPMPPLVKALHKELERLRSLTASGAGDCAVG